jgi:hypothetical protein
MKKILVVLVLLIGLGCVGMTSQQKLDTGVAIANQVYMIANAYYQMQAPSMTQVNADLWYKYLSGFKLALETGQDVAGYVIRWFQFTSGY